MKYIVVVALMLVVVATIPTSTVRAQDTIYTTKEGYVGCASRKEFDRQGELLTSGDNDAWAAFIKESGTCIFIKGGLHVYRESARGLGIIRIRPVGRTVSFFTYTEILR